MGCSSAESPPTEASVWRYYHRLLVGCAHAFGSCARTPRARFSTNIHSQLWYWRFPRRGVQRRTHATVHDARYDCFAVFLCQQLPLLFNELILIRAGGLDADQSLRGGFYQSFGDLFAKRKVSTPLVFTTICWMKSVSALQGDGGLGRAVSLTISNRWELQYRLERAISQGGVRRDDPVLPKEMKSLIARLQQQEKTDVLLRANPILAGFLQLDNHFQFLQTGCNAVLITWRFRAFCHMYAALKDSGLLESIPFFEDLLSIYERAIFTPSRAAVTYGSFLRTYLLSVDISAATVDAFFRDMKMPPPEKTRKVRERYHIHDLSRVFSILVESNLSVLQRGSSSMPKTLKGLLGGVADISRQELLESRVLSRDTLKLSDDLTDLFKSLCAVLGHREVLNKYLAPGNCPKSRLEESVMLGLMPLLDCLELDGSVRDTEEKVLQEATNLSYDRHGGAVAEYCRQAANTIARRFIKSEETSPWMETAYFVFPDTPNWISLAFSDVPFGSNAERKTRFANFNTLMAMLERSTGPLFAEQTKTLKELIKADPGLLELSHGSSSDLYPPVPNPTRLSDLPMLLHQAAAGPARDKRLVEWMVQMGALHLQPTHCRSPLPSGSLVGGGNRSQLCNQLAVHSAAAIGMEEIVRILLVADHMRDLNTYTYHTKETLVHLVVKHGYREMFTMLL